ncbi:hypothetical protein C8D77_11316 [Mesorhizobium loti]|jgi:hypothetical protein|uniref:Uncharacterized protein n=1 Tax=Rhizobium loti TaxID=381 RepID=A0A8E2W7H4_RHILI|nr:MULTISPECIES: hypothetical protein [Mesorhizobium]PWJ87927.1 hypothetical protein C8D77_11316 [Mesorhizobium loti]
MIRDAILALAAAMSHATQPAAAGLPTGHTELFLTRRLVLLITQIPIRTIATTVRQRGG